MEFHFYKYQGTGNDFVIIDNRMYGFTLKASQVSAICDRRFGIGADGLILLQTHQEYDFEMTYFNSDGTQSMCGNGSRCAVHLAHKLGLSRNPTTFLSTDGLHTASIEGDQVNLSLHDVDSIKEIGQALFVNTGSPHHIEFAENNQDLDIVGLGRTIRYSDQYKPDGANINFVSAIGANSIDVRTYERGVEAETLSCGTGVTAASIAASRHNMRPPISVRTKGGTLSVDYQQHGNSFTNIQLIGPAVMVFEGNFILTQEG